MNLVDPNPSYVELPSGLVVPEDCIPEKRPKAVDLFCGCGGSSCGFISAGFDIVAAVDSAPDAAITYMHNLGAYPAQFHWIEPEDRMRMEEALQKSFATDKWKRKKKIVEPLISGGGWIRNEPNASGVPHFFLGDIRKLTGEHILQAIGMERGELDCVCGSPPCQGYSTSGKRQVLDPRNSLVFEFARLVIELHPKTMMFENVPGIIGMVTPDGVPVVDALCRVLEDGGFGTLNALKRSLAAQAGSVGMLRGKSAKKAAARVEPPKEKNRQRELFA